jgi:PsbN protein
MRYNIKVLIIILYIMETATIIVIFVSSLLLGITTYSIYTAFGPTSKNLRDPFEEHED